MIYDCFLYNGEQELFEIRADELSLCKDWVTHIIVESRFTFTGLPKPLTFSSDRKNILYMIVNDITAGSPWDNERFQRNEILKALKFSEPKQDDIVIISDVDEVPRAKQVNEFLESNIKFASLLMDKYAYYLNCLESEQSWDRARIMKYSYLQDKTPEEVRNGGYDITINHAGWHWSWLYDPVAKLRSFSHQELNTEENRMKVMNKENIWDGKEFKIIDINLSHPEHLFNNQEKYKHLINASI